MELRHLRYFLAAAEGAHFRRAAESLNVSQPTLSHQIQQLETELGTALFDRVGRRVRLTPAGELFRDHARRVLRELEAAQAGLDDLGGLARGRLTVGAVQTVNAYLVPPVAAQFHAAHPGVLLRVEELSGAEVEAGVADGRLDLGVSFLLTESDEVAVEPLFEEELVLVVPAGHRWAVRGRVRVADLAGQPLTLMPGPYCTRKLVDDTLRAAGVEPLVAIEVNSAEGTKAIVRRGGPPAVLPALALSDGADGLCAVRLERPTPRRRVGLLTRRGTYPSRVRDVFAAVAREAVGALPNLCPLKPTAAGSEREPRQKSEV